MADKSVPPHARDQDAAIAPTAGGPSSHVRVQLEYGATSNKSVRRRFIVDHFRGRRTREWLECCGTGGDRGAVWDAGAGDQGLPHLPQRTTCSRPISAAMRPTASVPGKCSAAPSAGSLLPFSVLTCAALPTSLRRRRPRR